MYQLHWLFHYRFPLGLWICVYLQCCHPGLLVSSNCLFMLSSKYLLPQYSSGTLASENMTSFWENPYLSKSTLYFWMQRKHMLNFSRLKSMEKISFCHFFSTVTCFLLTWAYKQSIEQSSNDWQLYQYHFLTGLYL